MDKIKIECPLEAVGEYENEVFEAVPVDLNKAFIPVDKEGKDNLSKTQENIRTRFVLGGGEK